MKFWMTVSIGLTAAMLATPAYAQEDLCAGLEGKKLTKCETKRKARLAKLRAKTVPFKPSVLSPKLAHLDADDNNPFNTDKYYLGTADTGIQPINDVIDQVVRVQAAVKLGRYVGELAKTDPAAARALAVPTVEVLISLKDTQDKIMTSVQQLTQTDPKTLASSPADLMKVAKGLAQVTKVAGQVPLVFKDLPATLKSTTALAKGAASSLAENPGQLAGTVKDAVKQR